MGRQLASFDGITYTYNEYGIRTSKASNGVTTKYYLDGTRLIEQSNGTDTLHFNYDRNGEAIGFTHYHLSTGYDDPTMCEYIYVKNAQGDVVGIYNSLGDLKVSYTYDPWDKFLSVESDFDQYERDISLLNPFRYRGYYYDNETGLYYLQSRYYDPETGRFLNTDAVEFLGATGTQLSYNAFAYCYNNPVMYEDKTGKAAITAVATALGVSTSTLVATAVLIMIIVDVITGGKVVLTLSEAIALVIEAIADNISSSITSRKTKVLSDTKAKLPKAKVYQLAYVNKNGALVRFPTKYSFVDALKMLGFSSAKNSLRQTFKYNRNSSSYVQRKLEIYSDKWGIYAHDQQHAKALASVCGAWESPEVHGSGKYGHYHDSTHTFHIWYGGVITY